MTNRLRAFALVGVLGLAGCQSSSTTTSTTTRAEEPTSVVAAACENEIVRSTPGRLQSPDITEASGLVVSAKNPGTLWINNDSGDSARLFAITATGALEGIYNLEGATAIDWEDLAIGPGPNANASYLYVGDIGDNGSVRPNVVVYRAAEPTVTTGGETHTITAVDALTLTYPDGAHDSEALMVDPRSGEIYLIAKHIDFGGPAAVYRAPAGLEAGTTTVLEKVGEIDLPRFPFAAAVTAADISDDGRAIGVRTYGGVRLWNLGPKQSVIDALGEDACEGPIPVEIQGETLGLQPDANGYFTVSEGANVALHRFTRP